MRTTDWTQELTQEDVEYIFSEEVQLEMVHGKQEKETITHVLATAPVFFVNRWN